MNITIKNSMTADIPDKFRKMDSMPEDPKDSVAYGMANSGTQSFVLIYPLPLSEAMPLTEPQIIIDSIHQFMNEKQGLIKVDSGKTAAGRTFAYSIVKSLKDPVGVQYILTFQMEQGEEVTDVQAFFDESGMTGMRDNMVYGMALRDGLVTQGTFEGWMEDPYDPEYTDGVRMNLSEDEQYDQAFPEHPLSEARSFVQYLIQNN